MVYSQVQSDLLSKMGGARVVRLWHRACVLGKSGSAAVTGWLSPLPTPKLILLWFRSCCPQNEGPVEKGGYKIVDGARWVSYRKFHSMFNAGSYIFSFRESVDIVMTSLCPPILPLFTMQIAKKKKRFDVYLVHRLFEIVSTCFYCASDCVVSKLIIVRYPSDSP